MNLVSSNNGERFFPRALTPFEKESLLWLLPEGTPGYRDYREYVNLWIVIGEGRRGRGNYILAEHEIVPDTESPLPQVFAYGVIEGDRTSIAVTLRELLSGQLEFEIANLRGESVPADFVEHRRWNFSLWTPGNVCPACGLSLREVTMRRENGKHLTIALCPRDRRIWIHDSADDVNHLVPVTNFYNEIMMHKGIRDPNIALDSQNLFKNLNTFSDDDLLSSFVSYNALRKKVEVGKLAPPPGRKSFVEKLISLFAK